jgi:hypothetical protein
LQRLQMWMAWFIYVHAYKAERLPYMPRSRVYVNLVQAITDPMF